MDPEITLTVPLSRSSSDPEISTRTLKARMDKDDEEDDDDDDDEDDDDNEDENEDLDEELLFESSRNIAF